MRPYCLRLSLAFMLLFTLNIAPCEASAVTVQVQFRSSPSFDLQFAESPRLEDVIGGIRFNTSPYWPAARLYRLSSAAPETMRTTLLESLNALQAQWQGQGKHQLALSAASLAEDLQEWTLAERILIPLNYDLMRLYPEHNPRVDPGRYLLSLETRPDTVEILGLVSPSRDVIAHRGGASIREYTSALTRLAGADIDWIYVISPDGTIEKAPIANWNYIHREIRPGGKLLVLFSPADLPRQYTHINLEIARLAQHRIAP